MASFLGITGLIAFYGFDGFMYAVGWLVAYLAVLLLVAELLRNTGKYTVADLCLVPAARPRRSRDGSPLDARDHPLLPDRADGRRQRTRQAAAAAVGGRRRDHRSRRADADLRAVRRHARDAGTITALGGRIGQ